MVDDMIQIFIDKNITNNFNYFLYAFIFYLPLIDLLQNNITNEFSIKYSKIIKFISIVWDLGLTVFSFFGSYYIFLYIYNIIKNYGFNATIHEPYDNQILTWIYYFVVSKVLEMFDTVLLILKNKKVIFLHWYHHLVTFVLSYYSFVTRSEIALWFCFINYIIHTIMYAYYFLVNFIKINNPSWITILQTLQMFYAIFLIFYSHIFLDKKFEHFAFGVYFVFAIYFIKYFIDRYNKPKNLKKN
jgi:hypothetical protein